MYQLYQRGRSFVFLVLLALPLSTALAEPVPSHGPPLTLSTEASELLTHVKESLAQPLHDVHDLPELSIDAIEKGFRELPRTLPISEQRELKYSTIHWRKRTLAKLMEFAQGASDEDFEAVLGALGALSVELQPSDHAALSRRTLQIASASLREKAEQAVRTQAPVGKADGSDYRIVPTRHVEKGDLPPLADHASSDHSDIQRWAKDTTRALTERTVLASAPEHGEGAYLLRDRWVLKPGDVVVLEQNTDYCRDLNTSVADPTSMFSHAGVFLEIEHEGKRLPAVLEVYSHGLRLLPAELYLSRRFSHYTEIHRFKKAGQEWPAALRELANKFDKEKKQWSYDFYAKEFHRGDAEREKTANCSNLPSQVLIELGCDPIKTRCDVVDGAQKLFKQIGLNFQRYLTPTDYTRDPELERAGVIDSMELESLLAQELVIRNTELEHTAGGILSQRKWNESKMPFLYSAKVGLLSKIYGGEASALAAANLTTEWPWTLKNFPQAPPKVIGLIQTIEPVIAESMFGLRRDIIDAPLERSFRPTLHPKSSRGEGPTHILEAIRADRPLSLHALEQDPAVQADLRERIKGMDAWFEK